MHHRNNVTRYSTGSKFFHWLIALLVILMLAVSFFLDDLPKEYEGTAIMVHKSIGLTILFLMILRIILLSYTGRPPLPQTVPRWQKFLARLIQYCFYIFLLLMPLSGWIMSVAANRVPSYFGLFSLPLPGVPVDKSFSGYMFGVHQTIAWILIALLCFHVLGAIKHHFFDKDDVLKKMMPGSH